MNKIVLILILLISEILFANGNTGGMDGGGGGTLPAQPASVFEIQEIAEESKSELLYLLNGYEWREKYNQDKPLYKKLFLGPVKAQQVLKEIRLEVRVDKPCYTSANKEVDASVYGIKTNTICLSAFRIAQKLDRAVAKREVIALLMHEISHFLGSTEEEAVEIQKDTSWWILNTKLDSEINGETIRHGFDGFEFKLRKTLESVNQSNFTLADQQLSEALIALTQFLRLSNSFPYKLFNYQDEQYQDLLRLKLVWARQFIQTQVSDSDQQNDIQEYDSKFNDQDFFIAGEEWNWDKSHLYRNEKIQKIHNASELIELLNYLQREYEIRSTYIYQVTFGMRWIDLKGQMTVPKNNSWNKYIGQYNVETVVCDLPNQRENETRFEITKSPAGLFFRKIFKSASMSDPIEFGSYNVNAYLNNYGELADGSVFMTHEMGGSWSTREFVDSIVSQIVLQKTDHDKFKLIRTVAIQPKDISKKDWTQTCTFTGSIQY